MSQIQYQYEEPRSSKVAGIILAGRVATVASLAVTIVILQTNKVTVQTVDGNDFRLTYSNYFESYKYVYYVSAIGIIYNLLQIPFAAYHVRAKKRLINSYTLLQLDFYADKIMSLLIGAGVGAAFGASEDLKKYTFDSQTNAKHFFDMNLIASVFILIGCLGSAICSFISSLALSKGE